MIQCGCCRSRRDGDLNVPFPPRAALERTSALSRTRSIRSAARHTDGPAVEAAALVARSTRDVMNNLATITDRKAGFRSLGDAWADTITSHGRLMVTVLGRLADDAESVVMRSRASGTERTAA
jgi:hypothetical protein